MSRNILAIIVTYNPDSIRLNALLNSLQGQVDAIVIVDNGSTANVASMIVSKHLLSVQLIELGANLGIAAAHNCGISFAREQGYRNIIIFDHDSVAHPGMVRTLLAAAESKISKGEQVAAIGPNLIDERLGKGTHFENGRWGEPKEGLVRVDHVVSSGCMIPVAALDLVGDMRSELFIDYVDTEWCLRARAKGLYCYGAINARMSHEFGEPLYVFGRAFAAHSPMRHYYIFRNSIWLWRQNWISIRWRFRAGLRTVLRLGFSVIFAKPRLLQWKMMWRGIRDGVIGKLGKGHE